MVTAKQFQPTFAHRGISPPENLLRAFEFKGTRNHCSAAPRYGVLAQFTVALVLLKFGLAFRQPISV